MKEPKVHCAHTKMMEISSIKVNPKNPNMHSKEQIELLASLISWHGWRVPITISEQSGMIVRGHARLEAAELLKLRNAPVDVQKYETIGHELADLLADNKIEELSDLNPVKAKELLKRMPSTMRSYSGLTASDIELLITSQEAKADDPDDPQVIFKATQEQSMTINRAIKEASNGAIPPGAALHLICAEYLG